MEVEVRAKIKNFPGLKRKLKAMGAKFGRVLNQKDLIFYPEEAIRKKAQKSGDIILRIRDENGKGFFGLKGLTDRKGVWLEHEFLVDNPREARAMIETLGFRRLITLEKKRVSGRLGKIIFCLDEIKSLGNYLEMEIITTRKRSQEAQEKIKKIFSRLGIDKRDFVRLGYPQIILKKKGWRFSGER